MTRPLIHDGQEHRPMTDEELQQYEELNAELAKQAQTTEAAAAAKQSARTKLKVLGLTDAEIAALVGA